MESDETGLKAMKEDGELAIEIEAINGMASSMPGGSGMYNSASSGVNTLLSNVALVDSLQLDELSTDESRMCTEESAERMTNSTEGLLSLSEDSSGRDTFAQAHEVGHWNSLSGAQPIYAHSLELDDSDEQMNGILGSYREILMEDDVEGDTGDRNALIGGEDTEEEVSNLSPDSGPISPFDAEEETGDVEEPELTQLINKRPNSLKLSYSEAMTRARLIGGRRLHDCEWKHAHRQGLVVGSAPTVVSSSHQIGSGLKGLAGVVSKEGELVSFVAQDLQEQIKRASPVIKRGDTPIFPQSRSSTPGLFKAVPTPQLQPVDPNILQDIEAKARILASSVDTILENLTGTLHSMSSLTVDCVDVYEEVVNKTCDSIDGNIKGMYQLMAKFEELGNLMRPVYRLSGHIKETKRMLDLLEQVVTSGPN